ncbi:MAG: polymer-forming cytoskeletal protein, partial [Lachnospiraceae bacterium]|nr:polymer-forming cytoskeletal protein [Lachnospiraceae bacterium]
EIPTEEAEEENVSAAEEAQDANEEDLVMEALMKMEEVTEEEKTEDTVTEAGSEEIVTESMADVFEAEKEPGEIDEAQEDAKVAERVDALINDSLLLISEETAVITDGMKVTGDIMAGSHMNITGTVVGNIEIAGKLKASGVIEGNIDASELYSDGAEITGDIRCKGSVKIGQNSVIIGNVSGSCAVVAGAVKGDIDVHGPVILDSTAVVLGNIRSQSVQISTGAVIEGMSSQVYAAVNPSAFFEEFQKSGGRRKKGR